MRYKSIIVFLLLLSCVERFDPEIDNTEDNLLVIEGMITDQNESYSVKITRTRNVNGPVSTQFVSGANVFIEDDQGNFLGFEEVGAGIYASQAGDIIGEIGRSYRLFVSVGENQYQSTFEKMPASLPIDSIYADTEFVQVQDEVGNVTTPLVANVFIDAAIIPDESFYRYKWSGIYSARTPNQGSTECWPTPEDFPFRETAPLLTCYVTDVLESQVNTLGSNGLVASSFKGHKIVTFNPSKRFQGMYSIEISQFSLTPEAYDFWKAIENQTTLNGGLFDPPPSQIIGNIRNVSNNDEIVLGYFSASSVMKKRTFLDPIIVREIDHYGVDCALPTGINGMVVGLRPTFCCDCRFLPNSTSVKPEFWP